QQRINIAPLALALALLLSLLFVASLFTPVDGDLRLRDIWPATSIVCILLGAAIVQITWAIPNHWGSYARWVPATLLSIIVFLPQSLTTVAYARQAHLEDVRGSPPLGRPEP